MWFTPEVRRILAYSKPVDLRKSIDGLVGLVKNVLEEDPLSGSLFVFINRRFDRIDISKLIAAIPYRSYSRREISRPPLCLFKM